MGFSPAKFFPSDRRIGNSVPFGSFRKSCPHPTSATIHGAFAIAMAWDAMVALKSQGLPGLEDDSSQTYEALKNEIRAVCVSAPIFCDDAQHSPVPWKIKQVRGLGQCTFEQEADEVSLSPLDQPPESSDPTHIFCARQSFEKGLQKCLL